MSTNVPARRSWSAEELHEALGYPSNPEVRAGYDIAVPRHWRDTPSSLNIYIFRPLLLWYNVSRTTDSIMEFLHDCIICRPRHRGVLSRHQTPRHPSGNRRTRTEVARSASCCEEFTRLGNAARNPPREAQGQPEGAIQHSCFRPVANLLYVGKWRRLRSGTNQSLPMTNGKWNGTRLGETALHTA